MNRVIDIHAHVFPDEVAAGAMPTMQEHAGVEACYDGTLDGLVASMDRAAIDVTVTQPVATKPSQMERINEWAATTAGSRIVPFGSIHPDAPDLEAAVSRIADSGFPGVKLHPEFQRFRPDDPRLDPLYQALAGHGLIVLFHAGLDIAVPTEHGTPDSFARMLDRHADLTVILAHMGGWNLWDGVREHLIGRDIFLDTSFARGHMSDETFLQLVEGHGADKVLFGTDGPWADAVAEVEWFRSLPLSDIDRDAIMGGNAAMLLGI